MALSPGTQLGRYIIAESIGQGGMGEVYRAHDPRLDRDIAVKILAPDLANDDASIARFEREAVAASSLNHPHILHIYDFGQEVVSGQRLRFIAMELIEGSTLRTRIGGSSEVNSLLRQLVQVAEALSKAHAIGVVHRDLKPENIMITADGYAKVLDFGLAKLTGTSTPPPGNSGADPTAIMPARTAAGMVVGTAAYMSPEQARGDPADARSDIFSFGAVLFEVLTGRRAFDGQSFVETLHSVLHAQPAFGEIRTPLQRIVRRCLTKDPAMRYESMEGLLADLRPLVDDESGRRRRPAARGRSKQIESIAVLPFVNSSGDADSEYLSDGIAETLINSLSHIPKLRVVPRTTAFRYKGRQDVADVARELNVRAVLTGHVSHRADRIIVGAELIDVAHDAQLWGDQYSRSLADLLDVQQSIAADISDQLRPKLSGAAKRRVMKIHTESPEAYQLYLKGRFHLNKRSDEGLRKAIDFFHQAIEHDPAYARGYAGVADGWVLLGWYSLIGPRDAFPKALAAASRAVELDPTFAEAHTSCAYARLLAEWDFTGAEQEFKHAISLNPSYAIAHHWYADLLQSSGRPLEALEEAKKACELDPLALILNAEVGRALYYARDFEHSIEAQRRTLDLEPNFPPSHLFLGEAYDQSGRLDDAAAAFARGAELSHDNPMFAGFLGYSLARSGRTEEARARLDALLERSKSQWVPAFAVALIHFGLGEIDEMARWMEAALAERSHWLLYAAVDPAFEKIWNDQRLAPLLAQMGDLSS